MRRLVFAAAAVVVVTGAKAQSVPAPAVAINDSWTYVETTQLGTNWRQSHVELTVTHAGSGSIGISAKVVGSTMPPREILTGPDWSRVRNVNGLETVVNRPVDFPLSVGKGWTVDYNEDSPNRQYSIVHHHTPYKVIGWEDVTVAAGHFHALKIEAEGKWSAAIAPAIGAVSGTRVDRQGATTVVETSRTQASVTGGRTYLAFWYVPAIKRWVKSEEDYYAAGGDRTSSYTAELESYKVPG